MPANYSYLDNETLVHVHGADAATFLQGQTTCDVREVTPHSARPGAYCTPQGRVLADFLLVELGPEHYALRLRADLAPAISERLARYVVFSKATVEVTQGWRAIACWGDGVSSGLLGLAGSLPDALYGSVAGDGFQLIQLDEAAGAFELYVDARSRPDLLQALEATLASAPPSAWEALQVSRGIARVNTATSGEYLPQALSYDLAHFISFRKGCYTGQEVVARLHYRGKSKRRLYLARLPGDLAPGPGAGIVDGSGDRTQGSVVNAARTEDGEWALLVSVAAQAADGPLFLADNPGAALVLEAPPYGLGEAAQ